MTSQNISGNCLRSPSSLQPLDHLALSIFPSLLKDYQLKSWIDVGKNGETLRADVVRGAYLLAETFMIEMAKHRKPAEETSEDKPSEDKPSEVSADLPFKEMITDMSITDMLDRVVFLYNISEKKPIPELTSHELKTHELNTADVIVPEIITPKITVPEVYSEEIPQIPVPQIPVVVPSTAPLVLPKEQVVPVRRWYRLWR